MDSYRGRLSGLQTDFLEGWFTRDRGYFLTGGGVLVGFLQAPRITRDLDLFTTGAESFEVGPHLATQVCLDVGAALEELRTAPAFRRYRVSRGDERTLVVLVLDEAPQLHADKEERDGIILDSADEILVNKICAVVGRGEPRDYTDVCFLSELGYDRELALAQAAVKDGGVDAASLLYVLQGVSWETLRVDGVEDGLVERTRGFFAGWTEELALRLFPGGYPG